MSLKEKRIDLGLSAGELAMILDVSGYEIATWEKDEASCPYQRMLELAMDALTFAQVEKSITRMIGVVEAENARMDGVLAGYEKDRMESEARLAEIAQWREANGV